MDTGTSDADAPQPPKRTRKPKVQTVAGLIEQGNRRLANGRRADARRSFTQATELDPQSDEAWMGLARAARDDSERREFLQRVLEVNPDHVSAREWADGIDRRQQAFIAQRDAFLATVYERQREREQQQKAGSAVLAVLGVSALVVVLLVVLLGGGAGQSSYTYTPPSSGSYTQSFTYPTTPPFSSSGGYSGGSTCRDGTHSSSTGRGTCSHHGGVAK